MRYTYSQVRAATLFLSRWTGDLLAEEDGQLSVLQGRVELEEACTVTVRICRLMQSWAIIT